MTGSKEIIEDQREAESERENFLHAEFKLNSDSLADLVRPTSLTKAASEGVSRLIADVVHEGNASALDVATKLQWMIGALEQARKLITDECVKEIERNQGKATVNGAEVIKKETGTKYLYSSCGDTTWEHWDAQATKASEAKKERENFLKAITKPITIADEFTGEMVEVFPPQKQSTTNIQVTFK